MVQRILITVTLQGQIVAQHAAGQLGSTILGRGRDCDIVLDNAGVSRAHAEISFDGEQYCVIDLGSSNGTFLNKASVSNSPLADGDVLSLGDYSCHVAIPSDEVDQHDQTDHDGHDLTIRATPSGGSRGV